MKGGDYLGMVRARARARARVSHRVRLRVRARLRVSKVGATSAVSLRRSSAMGARLVMMVAREAEGHMST